MKSKAARYLIPLAASFLLIACLFVACAQSEPSIPAEPSETYSLEPPASTKSEPPEETPSVDTPVDVEKWYTVETLEDSAIALSSSPIQITYIHYKGKIYPPEPEKCVCYESVEADEYVVIKNLSENPQDMGGWVLTNLTVGYPSFTFPSYFVLGPGQITRVYTNMIYPECQQWREFGTTPKDCAPFMNLWLTFNYGVGGIWSNDKPDVAVLYNSSGEEVFRKSYTVQVKNE